MTNKPKAIGTAAETAVVNFLLSLGYTKVQVKRITLAGAHDLGDVHLIKNDVLQIVFEVKGGAAAKNASRGQIEDWWDETLTEQHNAEGRLGVLVTQKAGVGPKRAGEWNAHIDFGMLAKFALSALPRIHPSPIVTMRLDSLMDVFHGV